jgi:hypothetical protein
MSNGVFSRPRRFGQYMTSRQKEKLHGDFIEARDAYHRAVAQVHRDRKEFIRRGLIPADSESSDK